MTIQLGSEKVSYQQFVDDVSEAVVRKLRGKHQDELLTTNEAAAVLGITPDHLRHIKDRYSPVKRGNGVKQGRLMFSRAMLLR